MTVSCHIDFHLGHCAAEEKDTAPVTSNQLACSSSSNPPFCLLQPDLASTIHPAALKPLYLGLTLSQILLDVKEWCCFGSQQWRSTCWGHHCGLYGLLNKTQYPILPTNVNISSFLIQCVLIVRQCSVPTWGKGGDSVRWWDRAVKMSSLFLSLILKHAKWHTCKDKCKLFSCYL